MFEISTTGNFIQVWDLKTSQFIVVLTTNLLITDLTPVDENGRFAYGTLQGEFKIVELNGVRF